MANQYGENYTKEYINVPSERSNVGEAGGKVKVCFDKLAAPVGGNDMYIGKIPNGARILSVDSLRCDTPTFNVAAGDLLSSETAIVVTLGAAPTADCLAWVTYVLD